MPEVHECFKQLSLKEMARLSAGDKIWLDLEPYHLRGKVYGRSEVTVVQKENNEEDTRIAYESGENSGSFPARGYVKAYKLVDQSKLEELIARHGERITSAYSAEEIESFQRFRREWIDRGGPFEPH